VQGVVADAGNVLIPKTAEAVDASLRGILAQRDAARERADTLREALWRIVAADDATRDDESDTPYGDLLAAFTIELDRARAVLASADGEQEGSEG
jgi:hypothetical protein